MKPMEQWIKERPLCVGWNDYDGAVLRWLNAIRSEALAERDKLVEAVRIVRNGYGVRVRHADREAIYYMDIGGPTSNEYWIRHERSEVYSKVGATLDAILKEHG